LKKERKEDSFIKKPFYKGGNQAMSAFVQSQLVYPKEAEIPIEGTVIVKYDIDHHGNVVDARVIKSLGPVFDDEALRVVRLLKFEVPKTPRRLKVMFHKDIQIHFKPHIIATPAPQPEARPAQVVYQVTSTAQKLSETKPVEPKPGVITYTFKIG